MPDSPDRIAPAPTTPDAHVAALSVRVSDLGEGLRSIRTEVRESHSALSMEIRALSSSMAERNKTPWATLVSFAAFLVAFGGIAVNALISPITQNLARIEMQQAADKKEASSDIKEFVRTSFAEMKELRNSIVPRGEHEQRWANSGSVSANLQRQVDDLNKTFGGVYSMRDALADIGKRLERVEHAPAK